VTLFGFMRSYRRFGGTLINRGRNNPEHNQNKIVMSLSVGHLLCLTLYVLSAG
jgi:hypothetical protein